MNKRRALLLILLALLLVVGLPMCWLMREYRQEQNNIELVNTHLLPAVRLLARTRQY